MKQTAYLVTGNKSKLQEWQRLFPASYKLEAIDLDVDEIQSLDLEAIVKDKAKRAYAHVQKPVIVEDISAGLEELGGLPGPFIKYFEATLGRDALYQLARSNKSRALVTITIAYYDGQNYVIAASDNPGHIVSARGDNGFGFDVCFVPDGHDKTFAQMTPAEKDALSHRGRAIKTLVAQLSQIP